MMHQRTEQIRFGKFCSPSCRIKNSILETNVRDEKRTLFETNTRRERQRRQKHSRYDFRRENDRVRSTHQSRGCVFFQLLRLGVPPIESKKMFLFTNNTNTTNTKETTTMKMKSIDFVATMCTPRGWGCTLRSAQMLFGEALMRSAGGDLSGGV